MEITKLSTTGRIIIPEEIRKELDAGTGCVIPRQSGSISCKNPGDEKQEEPHEVRELDRIWKQIDSGACTSYDENDFFERMLNSTPSADLLKADKNFDVGLFMQAKQFVWKQSITQVFSNPEAGTPLNYKRGERALYLEPFRLVYAMRGNDLIVLKFGSPRRSVS